MTPRQHRSTAAALAAGLLLTLGACNATGGGSAGSGSGTSDSGTSAAGAASGTTSVSGTASAPAAATRPGATGATAGGSPADATPAAAPASTGSGGGTTAGSTGASGASSSSAGSSGTTEASTSKASGSSAASASLPTNATDYADAWVRAWGAGDQARMDRLGTQQVQVMLRGRASAHWKRVSTEGAAGSVYVTYQEETTGETFVLQVDNMAASAGRPHAVVGAKLGQPG